MASPTERSLVLSSEHGTNFVPRRYAALFAGREGILETHRGHDIGSADLAGFLARARGTRLHRARVTRLLVDCNRSPHHRHLFSDLTRSLPSAERERLLARYYRPYREAVAADIARRIERGDAVLHVSVHSFTRSLDGRERNADIGLLYDPGRPAEQRLCLRWQSLLRSDSGFRVRRNYPYRGVADGLVTSLRRDFPDPSYAGVELEVCQDIAMAGGSRWSRLKRLIAATLSALAAGGDDPAQLAGD